jgi:predicted Zn-dependent protease
MNNFVSARARKRGAKWRLSQLIKLEQGCIDCGYNEHAVALQFDHVSDDKKMNVSDMIRSDYAWSSIMEEIRKCEVRCANCHSVMTAKRKKTNNVKLNCETYVALASARKCIQTPL